MIFCIRNDFKETRVYFQKYTNFEQKYTSCIRIYMLEVIR